jgi:hypothetical protein
VPYHEVLIIITLYNLAKIMFPRSTKSLQVALVNDLGVQLYSVLCQKSSVEGRTPVVQAIELGSLTQFKAIVIYYLVTLSVRLHALNIQDHTKKTLS